MGYGRTESKAHDEELRARLTTARVTAEELRQAASDHPAVALAAFSSLSSCRASIRRFMADSQGLNVRSRDAISQLANVVLVDRAKGAYSVGPVVEPQGDSVDPPAPVERQTVAVDGPIALTVDGLIALAQMIESGQLAPSHVRVVIDL